MLDEAYPTRKYEALTGQPDLYERMDRMVAFGMDPNDSETPYMADESRVLYLLLRAYWQNPTEINLQTALGYFSRLYDEAAAICSPFIWKAWDWCWTIILPKRRLRWQRERKAGPAE